MEKKCFSVTTKEFNDCLSSYFHYDPQKDGPEKRNKRLTKFMDAMEGVESQANKGGGWGRDTDKSIHCKRLNSQGDGDIFVLSVGWDRALAVQVEQNNKKIFIWFWVGSHETYSKKINQDLKQSSKAIQARTKPEIIRKIHEIEKASQISLKDSQDIKGNLSRMRDAKEKEAAPDQAKGWRDSRKSHKGK